MHLNVFTVIDSCRRPVKQIVFAFDDPSNAVLNTLRSADIINATTFFRRFSMSCSITSNAIRTDVVAQTVIVFHTDRERRTRMVLPERFTTTKTSPLVCSRAVSKRVH